MAGRGNGCHGPGTGEIQATKPKLSRSMVASRLFFPKFQSQADLKKIKGKQRKPRKCMNVAQSHGQA